MGTRVFTLLLALLQPLILLYGFDGGLKSFSKACGTDYEPIFILCNILVTYAFIQMPRWKISGVLLLLLTCFNTHLYSNSHNLLAIAFFVSCLFAIKDIYFRIFYTTSMLVGGYFGLFYFEFYSIYVLCIYHTRLFYIEYKYKTRNNE